MGSKPTAHNRLFATYRSVITFALEMKRQRERRLIATQFFKGMIIGKSDASRDAVRRKQPKRYVPLADGRKFCLTESRC